MEMPLSIYNPWFEAICLDDVVAALEIIRNAEEPEKRRLLDGYFRYDETVYKTSTRMLITRPIILAMVHGARRVLDAMLENGCDPTVTETDGNNVIHGLVMATALFPDKANFMTELYIYLRQKGETKVLEQLLMSENEVGLRPLEYAAQQGTFRLLLEIHNTDVIYVKKRVKGDVIENIWCDVTDYETRGPLSRQHLSPMYFISNMDVNKLGCDVTVNMMTSGVIQTWMTTKREAYTYLLILFAAFHNYFILWPFIVDLDSGVFIRKWRRF